MRFTPLMKAGLVFFAVLCCTVAGFSAEAKAKGKEKAAASQAQVVDGFGIFSETVPLGIQWDTDAKLDIWQDFGGGMYLEEDSTDVPEGAVCWKLTGTGKWMGFGVRVDPIKEPRDLSAYKNGALNFWAKSTANFKVGVKSVGKEKWMTSMQLTKYGFAIDGKWHQVKIPFADLPGLDMSKMEQLFMWVSDAGLGYKVNNVYYLDNIYYSK